MSRKHFGTDGVRGEVGAGAMTAGFALRLASSAVAALVPEGGRVVIGKDTRISGYMFESALEAGFVAAGADVMLLGPLPTPGIAYLTRELGADLGVVISASHNPYYDNGIKFFGADGRKLSDESEEHIESLVDQPATTVASRSLGRAKRVDNSRELYQDFCISSVPADISLEGLKIVVDCAHGAAYKVAPRSISELGAEIIPIGCSPNGWNINDGCGSTQPELLSLTVKGVGADLGVALDGDGDRLIMVDHRGRLVDGDDMLFVLARARQRAGKLRGPVVGTLMSNLGLEKALASEGIEFKRAPVGDRYVMAMLREHGGELGGETSGHLICLDKTTTGDGLIAALQMLCVMKQSDQSLAELVGDLARFPQTLINVQVPAPVDLDGPGPVSDSLHRVREHLGDRGRVVLRPSGTEPVVRVMVEGEDPGEVENLAEEIAGAVRSAASG